MACGSRLGSSSHEWLKRAITEYIEEEYGHEQWILNDIAAAGGNPAEAAASKPHITTQAMVAYAYHQVDRKTRWAFLAWCMCLRVPVRHWPRWLPRKSKPIWPCPILLSHI